MELTRIAGQRRWVVLFLLATALLAMFYIRKLSSPVQTPAAGASVEDMSIQPAPTVAAIPHQFPYAPDGRRLNAAGLPIGPPAPPPQPIPVKAAPGQIIGYATGKDGNTTPIRAGSLPAIPNSQGTYVAVDMWADGGSVAVAPRRTGPSLTREEIKRALAEDDARDLRETGAQRVEPLTKSDL